MPNIGASGSDLRFPISAITRDHGDSPALCLRHSAHDPPGGSRFVESKDSTPIRPTGDRPVKSPFFCFSASNLAQFFSFFLISTVRPAEGCNLRKSRGAQFAALQTVIVSERRSRERSRSRSEFGWSADRWLLTAKFSKNLVVHTLRRSSS